MGISIRADLSCRMSHLERFREYQREYQQEYQKKVPEGIKGMETNSSRTFKQISKEKERGIK